MPWHPCVNSRDTITQADGQITNFHAYPEPGHTVTSYCRDSNGTWLTWTNPIIGDTTNVTSNPDNDPNKSNWPNNIANAFALSVGYFPDDGSAPIIYDLAVEPGFTWGTAPTYSNFDPCSVLPIIGQQFSDAQRGELVHWFMDVLDVQVRTDGANVWVVVLAREDVRYPWLADCGASLIDRCGVEHPPIEDYFKDNPFDQDTGEGSTSGDPFWKHYQGSLGGGQEDDAGVNNSFRWHPARITVFAGDIGGFTRIDTVEAAYNNSQGFGLCGDIEACASPAEPGVCHVMWSEAGSWNAAASELGQRISYSRWDFTSKLLDVDLVSTTESAIDSDFAHIRQGGTHYNSDANWCWTTEYILRNDHGSPAAIICPWPDSKGPGTVEYWDLSDGTANSVQTLSVDLIPSTEGIAHSDKNLTGLPRKQHASSLYIDPLLADVAVYLICITFHDAQALYRIPCDGSVTFDFMDGVRLDMYSVIPGGALGDELSSDFVSDPGNVWVPSAADGPDTSGMVLHLTRTCTRTWELLPAFPVVGSHEDGAWAIPFSAQGPSGTSPPSLISDTGGDWLAGGGYGPVIPDAGATVTNVAAIRAKICRCCVPCIERIGLHIWEKV